MKKLIVTLCALLAVLTLAACSAAPQGGSDAPQAATLDIPATWENIKANVQLNEMMALEDAETLAAVYPLLDLEKVASYSINMAMINVKAEEVAIVEAKTAEDVESVKAALEGRLQDLLATWERYLPDQYEIVKQASVKTNGNYVYLVVSPNAEAVEKIITDGFAGK